MNNLLALVLAAFATYRVGYMLAREDGPFDLFSNFRGQFTGSTWFASGIRCFYCVSFWVALLFSCTLLLTGYIRPLDIVLVWPGIAGIAVILDKYWLR